MRRKYQPRFKIIKHRNGTYTLIDNQTGLKFLYSNYDEALKELKLLLESKPTNTQKFYNNYIICN